MLSGKTSKSSDSTFSSAFPEQTSRAIVFVGIHRRIFDGNVSKQTVKISGASRDQIREGRLQGVGQCLVREYRMVCHVLRRRVSKDFFEGCRAILLDKDKNPKWEPASLELVSDEMVDQYFAKVDDEDWEDLKLPIRSNLPASVVSKL